MLVASSTAYGLITQLPAAAVSELRNQRFAVVPNFAPAALVTALANDVGMLREQQCFETSEVGEDDSAMVEESYRVCESCYLYPPEAAEELAGCGDLCARQQLYASLDSVRDSLCELRPLEPSRTEGLYIYYPHGGFYRAHLDAAPKGSGYFAENRVFSYLLYLNDGWRVEHGGCLRLFPDGSDDGSFVDVEPRAGTLVVFRSDEIMHEVLATSAPRLVVAGWWHAPPRWSRLRKLARRAAEPWRALLRRVELAEEPERRDEQLAVLSMGP